jgi:urease accessory protein
MVMPDLKENLNTGSHPASLLSGEPQGDGDGNRDGDGGWHGSAWLRFAPDGRGGTGHQGGARAPLRLQRAFPQDDGRCELPILHTAGGLVGGDRLTISTELASGSRALLTSVAAQKVYGSVGRSRRRPGGSWTYQRLEHRLAAGADLEWLPQELVLYADGLYDQEARVELAPDASWLGAEVVRLGRTAAGEDLGRGCWRSRLEIRRSGGGGTRWELVDRLQLGGAALAGEHGMAGMAVFGSLVWAAPAPLDPADRARLLAHCRADRAGLEGAMACGALEQGLVARYRGPSSTAARHWFTRIWARIRSQRGLAPPQLPRVWPFQEDPLGQGRQSLPE